MLRTAKPGAFFVNQYTGISWCGNTIRRRIKFRPWSLTQRFLRQHSGEQGKFVAQSLNVQSRHDWSDSKLMNDAEAMLRQKIRQ
jgi:hypothetical protein